MNDKHLNQQINSYYNDKKLDPDKLEQLLSQTKNIHQSENIVSHSWSLTRSAAIAASIFAVIILALIFKLPGAPQQNLAILVAEEIALNHNKQLDIEFKAESYSTLRTLMKKLDFNPVSPSRIDQNNLTLIGTRYCSIQGQLAAQIKLKDSKGNIRTLYQTQLNPKLSELPEKDYLVNGVKITQWQEHGLFFGLASTAD